MKKPGYRRQDRFSNFKTVWVVGLAFLMIMSAGLALASGTGDGGHGTAAAGSHEVKHQEGEQGGGEGHAKGWVATDTYRVINFAVLAVALVYFLKKPITQGLNGRIDGIRTQLETLETRKKEAETQLAQYDEKLAQMDQEAKRIMASYIQQGEDAKARMIEQAKLAAEKLEAQAQRNIDHHFLLAKQKLQAELIEKALVKAEELIKSSISDNDQERLVEEYLDKVVA